MILSDGYLIRKKNGFIHGYASNVYLIPELKLGITIHIHICAYIKVVSIPFCLIEWEVIEKSFNADKFPNNPKNWQKLILYLFSHAEIEFTQLIMFVD